jgi:hypothetical protein
MNNSKALAALLFGAFSAIANAAPTQYSFDTVTAINLDASVPSISGVLVNSTGVVTVSFVDNTNVGFRYVVNRCVPMFLTAMEKPGRYVLRITVDPAVSNVQLIGCRLDLKI